MEAVTSLGYKFAQGLVCKVRFPVMRAAREGIVGMPSGYILSKTTDCSAKRSMLGV